MIQVSSTNFPIITTSSVDKVVTIVLWSCSNPFHCFKSEHHLENSALVSCIWKISFKKCIKLINHIIAIYLSIIFHVHKIDPTYFKILWIFCWMICDGIGCYHVTRLMVCPMVKLCLRFRGNSVYKSIHVVAQRALMGFVSWCPWQILPFSTNRNEVFYFGNFIKRLWLNMCSCTEVHMWHLIWIINNELALMTVVIYRGQGHDFVMTACP